MSLASALAKLTNIYLGLPIFIGGTLGNLLHIRLLWRNRHNSCAFLSASTDDAVCRIAFSLYLLCFPFVLRLTWVSYSNCAYTYIYMYIFYAVRAVLRIFVNIIFFSLFSSYFGYLLLSLLSLLLLHIYIHIDLSATYYYSCM